MKRFLTALAAVACLATFKAAPAAAYQQQGFYAGAFGAANWLQVDKKKCVKLEFDTGYGVGIFAGYKFCGGFRAEAEVSYRHNKLRKVKFADRSFDFSDSYTGGSFTGSGSGSGSFFDGSGSFSGSGSGSGSGRGHCRSHGHFQSWSYMVNGYYDVSLNSCGCDCTNLVPYVGFGIGYSHQELKVFCNDKKNGFAWQAIVGLSYLIDCNFDLGLEYRFLKGPAQRFYNHDLALAFRYHF